MSHVRLGQVPKISRRKSAYERHEKHLSNHLKAHQLENATDEFTSHDKTQRAELNHLKELGI
jgi:hypothetical protein